MLASLQPLWNHFSCKVNTISIITFPQVAESDCQDQSLMDSHQPILAKPPDPLHLLSNPGSKYSLKFVVMTSLYESWLIFCSKLIHQRIFYFFCLILKKKKRRTWCFTISVRCWQLVAALSLINLWTRSFSASWVHWAQTAVTDSDHQTQWTPWQLRLAPSSHKDSLWLRPIHRNREKSVVFAINNVEVLKHHLLPHPLQAGCHASPINCLLAKCIFAHYLVLSFDCMCLILIIIGAAHCHWASHVSYQIRLKTVY